jgi:hypothetical protein
MLVTAQHGQSQNYAGFTHQARKRMILLGYRSRLRAPAALAAKQRKTALSLRFQALSVYLCNSKNQQKPALTPLFQRPVTPFLRHNYATTITRGYCDGID